MDVFETIEPSEIIRYAIALVVIVSALAAILYTIWGGFLLILSAGAEEKVKSAINHIRHALIGVGFIVLVLFVVPLFANLLGLPYGDYAKPASVFQTISEMSSRLFGIDTGSSIIETDSLPSDFSNL